ncbi:TIGR03089 family protein [Nocardiopsis gilva YIM 90087]|uniref:TIGR03089 family protein n=1 Tax=Nocardiopsis gilva YIM 90087 TaxID=1235441 RepID=A0A223SBP2_9ACTN|nr:TIGR03089 family protein [Nocardiopsis gilva]ASU85506.1 TIGR03089 family protein [Nocardiopsis gilva YIM 90087]
MTAETPWALWRAAVSTDPARPFVTAYDADTGGRVELSYATFDNWVAKTANMLLDGLAAEPGDRVVLALPVHWQSLVWLLACWSTGMTAVPAPADEVPEGDIAVADAARLEAALDTGAREVVGTSLHPLGAPLADCPPPAMDYAVEVRSYGDHFAPAVPVAPDTVHLDGENRLTGADLVAAARTTATDWQLTADDRVAIITAASDSLTVLGSDLSRFLAPVFRAVPLVLLPGIDSANLQSRLDMERATALVGAPPGTPALTGDIRPLS